MPASRPRRSTSATLREGAIAIRADPGDRFELRKIQACPLTVGREHSGKACQLHLPPKGAAFRLRGLDGLTKRGGEGWVYEGGELSYDDEAPTRLSAIAASDFRLTFEVTGAEGHERERKLQRALATAVAAAGGEE